VSISKDEGLKIFHQRYPRRAYHVKITDTPPHGCGHRLRNFARQSLWTIGARHHSAVATRHAEGHPRPTNPVTYLPIRLPFQSSSAPPVARALSPSAPWQLFPTSARRVPHHPEMRRRWRRWLGQVECQTRRLLRALVQPSPARRAGIWRLRFLCPVSPPV
jgi:hypothetical protein